jgi:tetratricopeptide (TPR) repeat protein
VHPMPTQKTLIACLLAATIALTTQANAIDTLVYRSAYEARVLTRTVNKNNVDYFALFLAVTSDSAVSVSYSSSLNGFLSQLDPKVARLKANKPKAKLIFKEVHTRFFKVYEENVMFERLFSDGTYNCVTGSMLYSLILDHYNIPYEIKEKPTHIYLVAFPVSDNILFETTNPRGLFVPDDKSKREYVSGLVSMKLTTQDHVNSVGVSNAFNEFYYANQNISLQQIAGLQYFNHAIAKYDSKDLAGAIRSATKSTMLYPCPKTTFMKSSLIREALANSTFESLTDISYLAQFGNSATDVKDRKYVVGIFGDFLDTKLITEGKDTLTANAYKILAEGLTDPKLKNEVIYLYELGMSTWLSMKGRSDQSLEHGEKAYALNPNDARLQDLISRAIILQTDKQKSKKESVEALEAYARKFPFLTSNRTYRMLVVYQYCLRAYSLFLEDSGTEAYTYLNKIETQLNDIGGDTMIIYEMIGHAYAEAGAYHFRRKEFTKAKEIMHKGLVLAPDHGELRERIRITEREEKY